MGDLIFVEGVPGSGKSTAAQFLARQLRHHGRPARWIYEEEVPTPFVPEMPAAGFPTWEEFADAHVERWQTFARAMRATRETVVVESFLLQRPVFTMLRRDADVAIIEALVTRFARAVAPLAPTLIYLAHPDPAGAWRSAAARSGGDWVTGHVTRSAEWPYVQSRGLAGLDGVIAYWRVHAALCDSIVSWLPMETHVIDVAAGTWRERRQQICTLAGVSAEEPAAPEPGELAPRAGRYHDGTREIVVGLEDGRLVLRGMLWASNALLPVASDVFDVEAWPLRVRFEDDALHWQGARLWWGGPTGAYARVTPKETP